MKRCSWAESAPEYVAYHDEEWGRPITTDDALYERLVLEGFQSGLSWLTILRKRDAFRAAFADFRIERVTRFGDRDVKRLLADAGIVRHRGKIESAINNARKAVELERELGSLAAYFRGFRPAPASRPRFQPRLYPCGENTCARAEIPSAASRCVSSASASPSPPKSPVWRQGATIRWPAAYGNLFRSTNARSPR